MLTKYFITYEFDEKDKLLTYFASKAGVPDKLEKSLDFYYNLQQNPLADVPKMVAETESDDEEGEHEVYDSENEELWSDG